MDTRDDTASEPAAPAVARRDGPDWGHLPHGNLTNQIIGAGFEVHNVLGAGFLEAMNFGSSVQFKRVVASPHLVRQATRDELRNDDDKTTARPNADEPRSPR